MLLVFIKSPYLNMWRLFVIYHSYLGFFLQIAEINYIYVAVMLYRIRKKKRIILLTSTPPGFKELHNY